MFSRIRYSNVGFLGSRNSGRVIPALPFNLRPSRALIRPTEVPKVTKFTMSVSSAAAIAAAHNDYLTAQFNSLPPIPAVEQLSSTVWRILGGNPGKFQLQGTNTYLLGSGRERLLIDTAQGVPIWASTLQSVLAEQNAVITQCIITHHHHDHIGGIVDLLSFSPDTKVYKHLGVPNLPEHSAVLPLNDGDVFKVEGATVKAVYTPGHAKDHVCFLLEEEQAVFSGDNVLGHGTTVFEDLKDYMDSLEKMQSLEPGKVYPAHGMVVMEGKKKIGEYIRHRMMRERQIVGNLEEFKTPKDAVSSMGLVKRIYGDVDEGLHLAAERGVVQVLEKLQKEGRVEKAEDGWFLVEGKGSSL